MSDIVAFTIAALAMAGLQAIPWVLLRRAEDRYCASLARWHAESVIREARYKTILRDFYGTTKLKEAKAELARPNLPGVES